MQLSEILNSLLPYDPHDPEGKESLSLTQGFIDWLEDAWKLCGCAQPLPVRVVVRSFQHIVLGECTYTLELADKVLDYHTDENQRTFFVSILSLHNDIYHKDPDMSEEENVRRYIENMGAEIPPAFKDFLGGLDA